eukprot:TRINITY_DN4917_c0_g1_i3.p1 TRINITY_DN4917_c0_g1~~TRINITY_DN4917_c0_g1_i3.p1  ORF type:complete len:485 (-),score=98.56 TRINITY_DN4917_c0_g1_i3:56-1510(-)
MASELPKLSNFIDGKYTPPVGGTYLDNFNPSTGKVYSFVPDSDHRDVELAVEAAKKAFPIWSKKPASERSRLLYKIANILESRLDEFARAESQDQGKPLKLARTVDIPRAVLNFRFFAGQILHTENTSSDLEGIAINYSQRMPIGVAGLISPWNLPLYLLSWKIAPAISVGNTCVCKPSELTPMTAFMLGEVLNDAGVPSGVVNIVFGLGAKVGQALVENPRVPLISFTGGTKTGEQVIKSSAPLYKKLSLELGGKNPNIIFEDAKLEDCLATTVRSSFSNQGEICLCGSRIYVQESIYKVFLEKFIEKIKALKVGDPNKDDSDLGALISADHLKKIEYYVNLAKEEGGKIETGGERAKVQGMEGGYFYLPTVITGLNNSCRTIQEEIFGPVVTISMFKTEEEVVEMANGVLYGLSASVWTENARRAHLISSQLQCGTVWVNCWMLRDLRMPFGGMKQSGIGREGGVHSMDFYTEQKTICVKYT